MFTVEIWGNIKSVTRKIIKIMWFHLAASFYKLVRVRSVGQRYHNHLELIFKNVDS